MLWGFFYVSAHFSSARTDACSVFIFLLQHFLQCLSPIRNHQFFFLAQFKALTVEIIVVGLCAADVFKRRLLLSFSSTKTFFPAVSRALAGCMSGSIIDTPPRCPFNVCRVAGKVVIGVLCPSCRLCLTRLWPSKV